jgi:TolB-like protein
LTFLSELRRRKVFRVAAGYLMVAWLALQVIDVIGPMAGFPDWLGARVLLAFVVGFPIVLVLAWIYDFTPEGVRKTAAAGDATTPRATGRPLDIGIIVVLAVMLTISIVLHFRTEPSPARKSSGASIAVLPFDNRSPQTEDAFFAEGIHDDILTHLAKIGTLKVISRTSMLEYAGTTKNMRTIGDELGVATILEGAVQRAGNRVRINVQLIDARDDRHLWAEIYDRELTAKNVFAIQSEIATAIAGALQAAISPETAERLAIVPTRNLKAYDLYLQASLALEGGDIDNDSVLDQLLQVVELDPGFGGGWALLSILQSRMYWDTREAEWRDQGLASAQRAMALAPDEAESHLAMGYHHYWGRLDYGPALESFTLAQKLAPGASTPLVALAYVQRRMGQFEESLANLKRAAQLDPRNVRNLYEVAEHLRIMDRYEQARGYLQRSLELAGETDFLTLEIGILDLEQNGDVAAYRAASERVAPDLGFAGFHRFMGRYLQRDFDAALEAVDVAGGQVLAWQYFYYPLDLLAGLTHRARNEPDAARDRFQGAVNELIRKQADQSSDPRLQAALGISLAGLGRQEEAIEHGTRATELLPLSRDRLHSLWYVYDLARIHAMNGDLDPALLHLETVVSRPGGPGTEFAFLDPVWDPYRSDPGFIELEKKYRLADA